MRTHFDLCIIGSGSGNTILDERFDDWQVAIVERGIYGGTCLNVGCIPTKMFVYPADLVTATREANQLGVEAWVEDVRWVEIRDRVFGRIDPISAGGLDYRKSLDNVSVFEGHGRFTGPKTLEVNGQTITADRFVIAAGARTAVPEIAGLDAVPYDTSDSIMRIDQVPDRLVIIGGGFIALEMAHIFDSFGSNVTIVARGDRLGRAEDIEISQRITDEMVDRVDVRLSSSVRSVDYTEASYGGTFQLELVGPEGEEVIEADRVLVAAGRVPNGDQLGVEAAGVRLDRDGYVITDDTMLTDAEGIWALGDVRSALQLKHVANHEARIVQHNLLHPDSPRSVSEKVVPYGIFTHPQIGSVGLKEHEAVEHGIRHVTAVKEYGHTAYGWAMEDQTSCAKLIGDPETRLLLGAHIIGFEAAVLIQQLVQGMVFGLTVDQMASEVMYPHPALSEVVENALLELADAMDQARR
ncbi:MAG: mycothione reductase [Actinobacteria bacterium]|nr:mycothione reductase [Actinomycetota bacterium]